MIRHRYRLNVWLAFADFFCALGLLMLALYGGRSKELEGVKAEMGIAFREAQDVLRVKKEAREVIGRVYGRLKDLKGWERISHDLETYAISIPEAALFPLGKSTIQKPQVLQQLAAAILAEKEHFGQFILVISGHTDDYPPADKTLDPVKFNMTLSEDRAKAVSALLLEHGLDPTSFRIATRGLGPTNPVVGNCQGEDVIGYNCALRGLALKPPDQTEKNRRIELSLGIYSPATAGQPR